MTTATRTATPAGVDVAALADRLSHASIFDTRLYAAAPAVADARERQARLSGAVSEIRASLVSPGVGDVIIQALSAQLDGGSFDRETFKVAVRDATTAAAASDAASQAVGQLTAGLTADIRQAERSHNADAMQVLRDALAEVVDVARQVLPLRNRTATLEDAAVAGQARSLFVQAAGIHDRIRSRQVQLTGAVTQVAAAVEPLVRQYGIVRDVSSLHPWSVELQGIRPGNHVSVTRGGGGGVDAFEDVARAGGEHLLEIACALEAWLPSEPQLRAAADQMRRRIEAAQRPAELEQPTVTGVFR